MPGTLKDLTEWAEGCLPGEESRARSTIKTLREADLFTSGPRGRHAPFMKLTDFSTAILGVLQHGPATKAHEAVLRLWGLPLSLLTLEGDGSTASAAPENVSPDATWPFIGPFFGGNYERKNGFAQTNLIGALTSIFDSYASRHDFSPYDFIRLEAAGDDEAVTIALHQERFADPWPEGPGSYGVELRFGAVHVGSGRAITTTRTLRADALNALAPMIPTFSRGGDDG